MGDNSNLKILESNSKNNEKDLLKNNNNPFFPENSKIENKALTKFQNKHSKISLIKESLSPMKIKESKEKLTTDFGNEETKESRVGKKLSKLTMKRVIILVLLLLLIIPLFDSEYYFDDDQSFIFGLNLIVNVASNTISTNDLIIQAYEDYIKVNQNTDFPLIYVKISIVNKVYSSRDLNLYR